MLQRFRRGFLAFLALSLVIFTGLGSGLTLADGSKPFFAAFSQTDGPVQLTVLFDPPVTEPGKTVTATLTLKNETNTAAAPTIDILIPPTLSLVTAQQLPIGTSLNAQANHLTWLPVVDGNGDSEQISLAFHASFADMARPQQTLSITMQSATGTQTLEAPVWIGLPPQVSIVPPGEIAVGQPVQLQANVTGPGPITQSWNLGDGRVVHAQNPTVVFPTAGTYQVKVQVANPLAAAETTTSLTVSAAPFAQFSADDLTPGVGQPVQFTNQSGGATPLTYTWDFGDGTTGTGVTPQHSYTQSGTFDVRLIVQNDVGQAETVLPIIVGDIPIADMVLPESGTAGTPITAQAFTDPSVTAVRWNMGDGQTVEGTSINYTYHQGGDFWVVMTAQNEFGSTEVGRWLTVASGPSQVFLPLLFTGTYSSTPSSSALLAPEPIPNEAAIILDVPPPSDMGLTPSEHLLWYINEARRLHNLPPLNYVYELTIAAQRHSDDMALYGYTGHTGSDDTRPEQRQFQAGYWGTYAGEATYWGYDEVTAVVEFWVNSPPHRVMILNPLTTDVGVGYTYNPNSASVWYWVAEFGITTPAPDAPQPSTETRLDFDLRHTHLPREFERILDPA